MKKRYFYSMAIIMIMLVVSASSCMEEDTSDKIQSRQSETMLKEATAQVGMPAIKNYRERRILKDILELRDREGLTTYTYLYNSYTGKLIFFGVTVGYGIPYATQYTSPQRPARGYEVKMTGNLALPQADPNGLFSPPSAEGTWVLMKNPHGKEVVPVYVEPRIVVSPFLLPQAEGNPR